MCNCTHLYKHAYEKIKARIKIYVRTDMENSQYYTHAKDLEEAGAQAGVSRAL